MPSTMKRLDVPILPPLEVGSIADLKSYVPGAGVEVGTEASKTEVGPECVRACAHAHAMYPSLSFNPPSTSPPNPPGVIFREPADTAKRSTWAIFPPNENAGAFLNFGLVSVQFSGR